MDPAAVLSQVWLEQQARYATVRWQISQRVTGSWVVTGKRREVPN